MADNSDHILDLDTGKIADSSKSESFSYAPSSNLKSNETSFEKLDADGKITT